MLFDIDLTQSVKASGAIVIQRPIEQVFDFVAVNFVANYPKWAPEVIEFEPIHGSQVKIGSQFRQLRYDQAQEAEIILQVTAFKASEQLILEAVTGEFRDCYEFEIGSDQNTTNLTFCFEMLDLEMFMRPFAKLIKTAIDEGIDNSLNNIEKLMMGAEN